MKPNTPAARGGRISFDLVRRTLGVGLVLMIGAAGTGVGQLVPPGTGGVAALVNSLNALGAGIQRVDEKELSGVGSAAA